MLTNTAFNAMLKTLEEPPPYLKFVLATTDPQKVPATVLSRCLQFNLRPMAPETILEHLSHVLAIENVPAEQQALRLLARAARGSMRDALSLTDQAIAFGSGQLQEASVRLMLGSVDRSYVFTLLDALGRSDGKTVVETSEALRLHGLSAASTLEEMTTILQRMAVLQAVPEMMSRALGVSDADDDADPEALETARLAQTLPPDETQLLYSLCLHGRGELGLAPDEYAALTMVLLRLLAFKPSQARSAAEPGKKPLRHSEPASAGLATDPHLPSAGARHGSELTKAHGAAENKSFLTSNALHAQSERLEVATHLIATDESASAPAVVLSALVAVGQGTQAATEIAVETAAETVKVEQIPEIDTQLGDTWSALVSQLLAADAVAALVRELALQSELRSQDGNVWTLRVERQSLNQSAACEKLQLALQTLLQAEPTIKLAVEVGPITDTPARRYTAAQLARQRHAEAVINGDPFVQDMIRNWGAKIVPGSIKPVPMGKVGSLPI